MINTEDIARLIGPPNLAFKVNRNFTIHLIGTPSPKLPADIFGSLGYRDNKRHAWREQFFYLSVGKEVYSNTGIKELAMLVKLAAAVERNLEDQAIQVIDVRLPRSHGYTGNKYGYRQVKELFPEIA